MDVLSRIGDALLAAVLFPVGLLITLVVVRGIVAVSALARRGRPLPIVVHPLTFEHNITEFVAQQDETMLELPSRLRDFLAEDPSVRSRLAPGPVGPVAPSVTVAAPGESRTSGWGAVLQDLVFPQNRSAYNLVLIPEVPRTGVAVGAQIVRTPGGRLVAAGSFTAKETSELVLRIGSFCVETVLEQPAVLRRAPRWEHWHAGAYAAFRRALHHQDLREWEAAHHQFGEAALLAPGNTRIALHHGSLHERRAQFKEAAQTYNAANCLWTSNIDIGYRLAAATVDHVIHDLRSRPDLAIPLLAEANVVLTRALRGVAPLRLLRRSLSATVNPRRRDPGERRYWFAWLRPDRYRAPLTLLRRTKGHEYRSALRVSIAGNELLKCIVAGDARHGRRSVERTWRCVVLVTGRKRSGWLAHWSAACYFSRAMELPDAMRPPRWLWRADARRAAKAATSRFGLLLGDRDEHAAALDEWQQYCSRRAVGELGRVLRNPCNQLDSTLLHRDPDMLRLAVVAGGQLVAAVAGLGH